MNADRDKLVELYWHRHQQWSVLADILKGRVTVGRTLVLLLSVSGAVLQTLGSFLATGILATSAAIAGAVALSLVPVIALHLLRPEHVRNWLRARSASEGLKSLVFRFLGRGVPFDGSEPLKAFEEAVRDADSWISELSGQLAGLRQVRSAPPVISNQSDYLTARVKKQINTYYRPKALQHAQSAKRFRVFEIITAAGAAIVGAVASALHLSSSNSTAVGMWVAVITTIGAALMAHATASRYDLQARTFFATARQLEDLLAAAPAYDSKDWSWFVAKCEDVISAENRDWMAKIDPTEEKN